jgi:hypothetical protein
LIGHFPSPTASRISTSAEQSQPFNPVAQIATILNDIHAISVGSAFLELHCLCTYNAANEIDQRAFIVVQLMFLLFPLSPNSTKAAVSLMRWDTAWVHAIAARTLLSGQSAYPIEAVVVAQTLHEKNARKKTGD